MSNVKSPSIFNPDEDDNCCPWKNDVEVWQALTEKEPKWQEPAIFLLPKGRAIEAVREISPNDLKIDDGIEEIIKILYEIFQNDETTQAYRAFKEYVKYRRNSD